MYYSGRTSSNKTKEDYSAQIPHFLLFKSLKPFVDKHLGDLHSVSIRYRTEEGRIAQGIRAEIIPKICDIWIDADEDESTNLGSRQKEIAKKAKLLMRALAHTDEKKLSRKRVGLTISHSNAVK